MLEPLVRFYCQQVHIAHPNHKLEYFNFVYKKKKKTNKIVLPGIYKLKHDCNCIYMYVNYQ